jgi:ubiquinone/menaquinone biosynthesis C-methylase UbiE
MQMEAQKRQQVEYHEQAHYCAQTPRRPDNSNPLIAWVNHYRLNRMLQMIGAPLDRKGVLSVCGGDGEEANYLSRRGARVTVADLSKAALQAARVRNPALCCTLMDAESLSFADNSFDWAIVREGLHHLARPIKGLYELERVSREGFAVMEGQDSCVVRLLARLGFGENRDPAGGYIYRFSRREIYKIMSSIESVAEWQVHTTWMPYGSDVLRHFPVVRRFIHPVINNAFFLRLFTSNFGRRVLKAFFNGLNFLIGRWGNCLILVAWKKR